MRAMVAAALAAAVALASAGNALAKAAPQTQSAPKAHKVEKTLKGLHLTEKQNAEVKQIMEQAKQDAAKAKSKEEKQQIRNAAYEKIKTTVLTDVQRKRLEEQNAAPKAKTTKAEKGKTAAKPVKGKTHKIENKPAKA